MGRGLEQGDERRLRLQGGTARELGVFQGVEIGEMGVDQGRIGIGPQAFSGL